MKEIKKELYVEYNNIIRFFAIIGVLFIHISAYGLTNQSIGTKHKCELIFFNCLGRIGVPFFLMIAGAIWLNLNKDVTLKKILRKNIKKLIVVFFMWSWLYSITYIIGTGEELKLSTLALFIKRCIIGHYHMWYIQMMVMLYIAVLIIREVILKKDLHLLIFILSFVTGFVFPLIKKIPVLDWMNEILNNMSVCVFSSYICYLLIGDYIRRMSWDKKRRYILYGISTMAFIARFYILIMSYQGRNVYLDVNSYDDILLLMQSIGAFVFVKQSAQYCGEKKLFEIVAKNSLYIYIYHDLILQILFLLGINASLFIPLIMVPFITVFVLLVCILSAKLLSRTEWFKKYYL